MTGVALPARVVVTGGDDGYFPLIDELCASVRTFRDAATLGIVVIDGGLSAQRRLDLTRRWGAHVLDMGWRYDLPASRIRGREHLKVLTGRTFLDQALMETEAICWIDADAWVQDIAAVDLMFAGAQKGSIAVVSQTSRYAQVAMTLKWAAFGYAQVRSQLYKNARRAGLGEALARRVGDKPTFNAGVFALRRDAPHWEAWRARMRQCLAGGRVFTSDQLALGLIVHVDGMPAELMPEACNYMGPLWSCTPDESLLVERFLPHAPVGIVHLAGYDAMRRDPTVTTYVQTTDDRRISRSLRRSAWTAS